MVSSIEISASPYTDKLNALRNQFPAVLDDFQKYYVMYHKNPEVSEFYNYFFENKAQLTKMNQDLKNIEDSLERRIKQMEREMRKTAEQIDAEKTRYSRAMRRQSHLTNASEGSEQAISDAQHQYHIQYVKNVEYILGVIAVFSLAIKCIK